MKPVFALLVLIWFSESSPLTPQATPSQTERESSWPKKPLHSNLMLENPNLFSPRMDYDEWTPLGRGDPLKNDPTYDYVPPVLERVHYWMEPSKRTPDPPLPNSGVIILGSRTEAGSARPTTPRYQTFQSKESQADSRIDTSSLLDPFFKLMDVSQFNLNFNPSNNYKPAVNRIHRPPPNPNNKQRTQTPQALQRPPYMMLMPPPPPPPPAYQPTNYITAAPEKAQTAVPMPPPSNPSPTSKNTAKVNPQMLAVTENIFKAVAISMPGASKSVNDENENEITVNQLKKTTTEYTTFADEESSTRLTKNTERHEYTTTSNFKHREQNPPYESQQRYPNRKPAKPPLYRENENLATITPPVTTTRVNTLTTDPLFKHYKQPSEPFKGGPFYLIIQGHSKVKTYGASKNPVNKLLTSNEIKYEEEEVKKSKFERKARRLRHNSLSQDEGNELEDNQDEMRSFKLSELDNLESLEEAFGKSNGGSSKKRYLGSNHRRKRFAQEDVSNKNRRLLSEITTADCGAEGRNATLSADNLDLESLIAISDDYDPEDVANILLKNEGGQGSGFGGLALSIASRSETEGEEM